MRRLCGAIQPRCCGQWNSKANRYPPSCSDSPDEAQNSGRVDPKYENLWVADREILNANPCGNLVVQDSVRDRRHETNYYDGDRLHYSIPH